MKVTTDAIEGREFDGKLTAMNPAINPATRTVMLQATLDNSDHALRAGHVRARAGDFADKKSDALHPRHRGLPTRPMATPST